MDEKHKKSIIMETHLTHWRQLHNPDYLGAYSLPDGKDLILTIKEVKKEPVTSEGGRTEELSVCYFEEDVKPAILNVTNSRTIQKIYDTPFIEEWKGKKVQFYVDHTKFQGEEVECLRIRPISPAKPKLTPDSKKWNDAVKFIKGGGKIEQITNKYDVDEKELLKAVQ